MKTLEILGAPRRQPAMSIAAALLLVGLLAGCGQKGPLYLPSPAQQAGEKPRTPPVTNPAVVQPEGGDLTPVTKP